MLTNTDLTIYTATTDPETRLDVWEREYVPAAWWYENEKSTLDTDGMHRADVYTIRIPDITVQVKKEDYLVKGRCELDIETPKDLIGLEKCKVMSANYNTFGDNPHIKVGGE